MTNGEKYNTVKERVRAFTSFCKQHEDFCNGCPVYEKCISGDYAEILAWLELEADEEKPLPCPFCGDTCQVNETESGLFTITCMGGGCFYRAGTHNSIDEAIAAHNRVALAVMAAKKKEEK